MKLICNARLK